MRLLNNNEIGTLLSIQHVYFIKIMLSEVIKNKKYEIIVEASSMFQAADQPNPSKFSVLDK